MRYPSGHRPCQQGSHGLGPEALQGIPCRHPPGKQRHPKPTRHSEGLVVANVVVEACLAPSGPVSSACHRMPSCGRAVRPVRRRPRWPAAAVPSPSRSSRGSVAPRTLATRAGPRPSRGRRYTPRGSPSRRSGRSCAKGVVAGTARAPAAQPVRGDKLRGPGGVTLQGSPWRLGWTWCCPPVPPPGQPEAARERGRSVDLGGRAVVVGNAGGFHRRTTGGQPARPANRSDQVPSRRAW